MNDSFCPLDYSMLRGVSNVIPSHAYDHLNNSYVWLDWAQPPFMVDVGLKEFSKMKSDCNFNFNVFLWALPLCFSANAAPPNPYKILTLYIA